MSKDKTLRIFCFGDSLTAGYSSYGAVYHPYSIALTKLLAVYLSDTQIVATDNGMPGDVVSQGAFAQRFESESSYFCLFFSHSMFTASPQCSVMTASSLLSFHLICPNCSR